MVRQVQQGQKSGLVIRRNEVEGAVAQRIKGAPGIRAYSRQEFTSTRLFGTSMSARRILGPE